MDNENIILIYKYLNKTLTRSEAEIFKNLLKTDKKFEQQANEIILTNVTIESLLEIGNEDLVKKNSIPNEKIIKLKKNSKKQMYFYGIAASLLLLVVLSLFTIKIYKKRTIQNFKIIIVANKAMNDSKNIAIKEYKNSDLKIIDNSNDNTLKENEQLIASADFTEINIIERSINDSVEIFLNNKQYEKAITYVEKQKRSKCYNSLEIGRIALIAAQNNYKRELMIKKAENLLLYPANLNFCYDEQRQTALFLLAYCSLFKNNKFKTLKYLDSLLTYKDSNDIITKAIKLKEKLTLN